MGSMYGVVFFLGVQHAESVQPVVAVERTIFYRERAAGMYSALSYSIAQVMIEIPYIFAQTVVYGIIVYTMIGFEWTAIKFFWYLFFMFFTLLYFTYYGMMAVAMNPNHHIAQIVSAAFYGIFNLFSGECQYGGDGTTGHVLYLGPFIFAVSIMMFNFQKR
ncbi:hypothetical protein Ddye_011331 [Dipteronia dyeriana]|uniref:ABC-2 type transporter transmembrane domain-containing protein n=1 Tax=Dipteronia dyeriana TaxID=168575 RepID=A0AAE0CGS1_9ROSI|nr:hypothetical protein Ddye_011331 [Dipteronia dyeriana]